MVMEGNGMDIMDLYAHTAACNWRQLEWSVISWRNLKSNYCAIHPSPTSENSKRKILSPILPGYVPNFWQLKMSHSLDMLSIEPWWDVYITIFLLWQWPRSAHIYWIGLEQHHTSNNQQFNKLHAQEMSWNSCNKWWS